MRIESSFNRFIDLFLSPQEQRLYPQIYSVFIVNLQNFIIFEALTYLALSILYSDAVPWAAYLAAILIGLITSWYEIQYGKSILKRPEQLNHHTARNLNFLIHTLVWLFRLLRLCIITLLFVKGGHADFSLLIAIFFCITAAMMSTSSYYYRTSLLFMILFVVLFIGVMIWQNDPMLSRHLIILLLSVLVLVFFSFVQRKKLLRAIMHSARNQSIAQDYKHSIHELHQFYRQQSRYLSAASHDLRQPLHALALVVNGAYRQTDQAPSQSTLSRMEGAIEHLTDAFNAMLLLSRFDSERLTPKWTLTPIQPIFDQLTQIFEVPAQRRGIVLHVQPTQLWTYTDAPLLLTILKNIVHYLIEFDGTQRIVIGVRPKGAGAHLQLFCRNAHRLYDQFNTYIDFDKQEALSLYIALAKRFCRILHHDFLPVTAQEHVKCLSIELTQVHGPNSLNFEPPQQFDETTGASENEWTTQTSRESTVADPSYHPALTTWNEATINPSKTVGSALEYKKVIVIDDDPIIADGIEQLLSDWGMEVTIALSLEMAQEIILEEGHMDLVISDYHLGDIGETGLDIIQALRVPCQPYGTRFVLISGDTTVDLSDLALNQIDLMVYKPIRPAQLRIQLAELMSPT